MLLLWWGAYWYVRKGSKRAFWLSFSLVNLFWWPLLWQTGRRIVFVIEHGGMERSDGHGSPLAFLLTVTAEQWVFLPLCFAMYYGWKTVRAST